jgi:hypothetical protein
LAWDPTPQYPALPHAVWRRREARVGRQASGSSQADAKKVGGRLGRVSEAQGARGRSSRLSLSPLR